MLVSTVQHSESAICIHMSLLFWIPFPFRSPQNTDQSSLCYTAGSHQSSVLLTCVEERPLAALWSRGPEGAGSLGGRWRRGDQAGLRAER